jgi:hypothetical protein
MDHHVPAAITAGLRQRGVDVLTCHEDGKAREKDDRLLERATELGRTLFTLDDVFLAIAHQWLQDGREFASLVYAHQLGITLGQAVRDLELISRALEPADMRNRLEFIPF